MRRSTTIALLVGVVLLGACDTTEPVGPPAEIDVASGDAQTATVATALPQPLAARVTDASGRPVSGVSVSWSAVVGQLDAPTSTTDAEGIARVRWTLSTRVETHTATASITGLTAARYTATATAGAPTELNIISGAVQSGQIGTPLPLQLIVRVRDAYDNAVVGVEVRFSVTGGTVAPETAMTDVFGYATTTWTLGGALGDYTATASLGSLAPVLFSATARAGPPATLTFVQQPSDTARNGQPFARQPILIAHDAAGNVLKDGQLAIVVTLAAGSGTIGGTTVAVVDDVGHATFTNLALVGTVGSWALRFGAGPTAATSNPITLLAGQAARITRAGGDNQVAPAGTAVATAPAVVVTDQSGNVVSGVPVAFSVALGGGSVTGASAVSAANGRASVSGWTLGGAPGTNQLTAASTGLAGSPMTFVATGAGDGSAPATLSGVITAANTFQPTAAARAVTTALLRATSRGATADRDDAIPIGGMRTAGRAAAAPVEQRLIVTFRAEAVGAPAGGARALARERRALPGVETAVRERTERRLAGLPARLRGVSPVTLSARVDVDDPARLEEVRRELLADPAVANAEVDGWAYGDWIGAPAPVPAAAPRLADPVVPNDSLWLAQAWHYTMIDLPRAWRLTTGSESVIVAVVDDGIRFDHHALAGRLTSDGYDFVSTSTSPLCTGGTPIDNTGDGNGYDADPTKPTSYGWNAAQNCATNVETLGNHGLHVAGTIGAAGNDGVGVLGVNWNVRIRPVRALGVTGRGSLYDIAQAVLYAAGLPADDGAGGTVQAPSAARIINLSLGGASGSTALQNAVAAAQAAGALLVVSMGNEASSAPRFPASYPDVLAVSAVGPSGLLASYSNTGSHVGVAAPGGNFAEGGGNDGTFGVASSTWNFVTGQPNYAYYIGTSMSAPHVSGVAALLLALDPTLTAAQLHARIRNFAVDAGAPGFDDRYGAGIVNARNALTSSLHPPRTLHARLYNAQTGVRVGSVVAGSGQYQFTNIADGSYFLFGGEDEDADGVIGVAGRRWGAYDGTLADIRPINVAGGGRYIATFPIGLPLESEPNNATSAANRLFLEGYVHGVLLTSSGTPDSDVYRITVPAGTYTFETSGWAGVCGYALEADTHLTVHTEGGGVIAENDDIIPRPGVPNLCSRVTTALAAGTYFVQVTGNRQGRYRLEARRDGN